MPSLFKQLRHRHCIITPLSMLCTVYLYQHPCSSIIVTGHQVHISSGISYFLLFFLEKFLFFPYFWRVCTKWSCLFSLQSRIVCYFGMFTFQIYIFQIFLSVAIPVLISCALGKFLPLGCLGEISLI